MLASHGARHGNRMARKHIGWAIARLAERCLLSAEEAAAWRAALLRSNDNHTVTQGLSELYAQAAEQAEAA